MALKSPVELEQNQPAVARVATTQPKEQWQFESTICFSAERNSTASSFTSTSRASFSSTSNDAAPSPIKSDHVSASNPIGFSFVNVAHPNEARQFSSKRAIRSHVAKVQHSRTRLNGTRTQKPKRAGPSARALQPRETEIKVEPSSVHEPQASTLASSASPELDPSETLDWTDSAIKRSLSIPDSSVVPSLASETSFTNTLLDEPGEPVEEIARVEFPWPTQKRSDSHVNDGSDGKYEYVAEAADTLMSMSTPQQQDRFIHRILSDGRKDPFWSYPIPYIPELEPIIDHYLVHVLVDVDFVTPPHQPQLMKRKWFPLSMTEPAIFWAVTLVAAAHFSFVNNHLKHTVNLFALKQKAIEHTNAALADPARSFSDATLGAVMKLASYEAIWGDAAAYEAHMAGLQQLIRHRGGLSELGLDGLLERTVLWIDSNGSASVGCGWKFDKKWYPTVYTHPPVDPAHFSRLG